MTRMATPFGPPRLDAFAQECLASAIALTLHRGGINSYLARSVAEYAHACDVVWLLIDRGEAGSLQRTLRIFPLADAGVPYWHAANGGVLTIDVLGPA